MNEYAKIKLYLNKKTIMDQLLFWNFVLATALGALIGTEREMPRTGITIGGASGF